MTIRVDFVQGTDAMAAGLSRAQAPLLAGLATYDAFNVLAVRFGITDTRLLFPFVYGPLPAWVVLRNAPLVHVANSWYAHIVPCLRRASIVTCHDLIELETLERGEAHIKPHRAFHIRAAFSGMLRARFIVCDSHAVANSIAMRAPSVADRIRVIYLGISSIFAPGPTDFPYLQERGIRNPYVLYVGSEQPRKNLGRVVRAVAMARRTVPDLCFVKVGHHQTVEGRRELLEHVDREGMSDKFILLESVGDDELVRLYRGAAATLLPSLSEGFGFPPLEAMASGCPAIVSDRGPLPEITGGDAVVVDPLDPGAIAAAIESVVHESAARHSLVERGILRACRFTWEETARQYAELYAEALSLA